MSPRKPTLKVKKSESSSKVKLRAESDASDANEEVVAPQQTNPTAQKNKTRLFIEERWISAVVGGIAALLIWLLANLLNNQILEKIESIENNYVIEKDARTSADSNLDKRLAIIEHDHSKQDKRITK